MADTRITTEAVPNGKYAGLSADEIQARIKELEAKREARAADHRADKEHAAALRRLELAEAIDSAETQHGPVGTHLLVLDTETEHGSVILKRPNKARYRAFQEKRNTKTEDLESLVRSCIVYPNPDRIDRMFEDLPGALARFGKAMAVLAGFRDDELTSK